MGSLIRRRVAAGAALAALLGAVLSTSPAAAADPAGAEVLSQPVLVAAVTFGTPTATSSFGKSLEFKQPVTIAATPTRVELLLTTPGSIGPEVIPSADPTAAGISTLDYRLDVATGGIAPNTTFVARWRVVDDSGRTWLGPSIRQTYVDDRFTWKTLHGSHVNVHWYDGDQAFGAKALKIGDDAVAATARLLGVTETDPIDFFIYADQQPFYDALGPGTRENVGGQARPDIRTLFALITPAEIDAGWIESVVPHELTHVVFATATDNPYHEPPHWLNEGLAVYLSDGYTASAKDDVASAVRGGSIIPLDGLAGAFPTTRDRFVLAYDESVSAVERIVRVNGREALIKLIRSYRDGVSDDEAFQAAIGRDTAGFEADWLAELGATLPTRVGPQPAPAGPLPAGWSGPKPNPSFEVVGSAAPAAPSEGLAGRASQGDGPGLLPALAAVALGLLVVAGGGYLLLRRGRPAARPPSRAAPKPMPAEASRPAASWTSTGWSLPRDVDPPNEAVAGAGGAAAHVAPPIDAPPPDVPPPDEPPADDPAR